MVTNTPVSSIWATGSHINSSFDWTPCFKDAISYISAKQKCTRLCTFTSTSAVQSFNTQLDNRKCKWSGDCKSNFRDNQIPSP
jgi:heterodisulfide reductase subunit A-like polyferredoxin